MKPKPKITKIVGKNSGHNQSLQSANSRFGKIMPQSSLGLLIIFGLIAIPASCVVFNKSVDSQNLPQSRNQPVEKETSPANTESSIQTSPNSINKQWYQGGTLHKASALEWQNATYENKLATCADFISALWEDNHLNPSIANQITSIHSMRPLAEDLLSELDEAMEPHPDAKTNRDLYGNQKVSSMATIIVVAKGWTNE